jgi:hypothetical protein
MKGMKPDRKPLPYPIPGYYTEALEVDASFLSHINAGSKPLPFTKCAILLEIAKTDPYWAEVDLIQDLLLRLHPELTPFNPALEPQKVKLRAQQRKLSKKSR